MVEKALFITKEVEFAAAHRLYLDTMSEKENFAVFGKCANRFGHGHNYALQVTVKGIPDPKNQMLIHFAHLSRILEEVIVAPLDHHNLNEDVPFMKGILPTSENVVLVLWDRLNEAFKGQTFVLHKLKLQSTPRNWVEYFGPKETA